MDGRAEENDWRETGFTEDLCVSLVKARPDDDPWRHFFMDVENVSNLCSSQAMSKSILDVTQSQMLFRTGPVFSEQH